MMTSCRPVAVATSLLAVVTIGILRAVDSTSYANENPASPTAFPALTSTPSQADTPSPIEMLQPTPTSTPDPDTVLDMIVSLNSPIEPPQTTFGITIEMLDAEATYGDWVLGNASGDIATGLLSRGESETVELEVDWSLLPLLHSAEWFYVFGQGNDGSTFAQVFDLDFTKPIPAAISPTPTASCGYARFVITTDVDVNVAFPDDAFEIGLANEGILACGTLDWQLVGNTLQPDVLSCSPTHGILEGSQQGGEANTTDIQCSIDWREISPGRASDYFLVLFSFPRVNGTASAHLIRIHAKPEETP